MISNVVAVYRLQCLSMPSGFQKSASGIFDHMVENGDKLNIFAPAKFSCSNKVSDKSRIYEYQLTFRTCEELEVAGHYAYALVMADGSKMILGSDDRPYPVTSSSRTLPDNMTDSQLWEVSVSYAVAAPMPVIP